MMSVTIKFVFAMVLWATILLRLNHFAVSFMPHAGNRYIQWFWIQRHRLRDHRLQYVLITSWLNPELMKQNIEIGTLVLCVNRIDVKLDNAVWGNITYSEFLSRKRDYIYGSNKFFAEKRCLCYNWAKADNIEQRRFGS